MINSFFSMLKMEYPDCESACKNYNFGICLKKGKRAVLQLDFPTKILLIIHRGHIKKSESFQSLLYYESEENLHIVLRFLKDEAEFDADTEEEKIAICSLLECILDMDFIDLEKTENSLAPIVPYSVLKDGVLEKKGNTAITTWNRRRIRISIGEFAYFKPGDTLALNVVQLRKHTCRLQKISQSSFQLSVESRDYSFRVLVGSKHGHSIEAIRDDWIKAFEQAMTTRRQMSHLPTMLQHSMSDNWFSSTNCLSEMDSIDGSHITERKRNNDDVNKHQNDVSSRDKYLHCELEMSMIKAHGKDKATTPVADTTSNISPQMVVLFPCRRQRRNSIERLVFYDNEMSSSHLGLRGKETEVMAVRAKIMTNTIFLHQSASQNSTIPSSTLQKNAHSQVPTTTCSLLNKTSTPLKHCLREPSMTDDIHRNNSSPAHGEHMLPTQTTSSCQSSILTTASPPPPPQIQKMSNTSLTLSGGVKLKQVFWRPVDKKQVSDSLWADTNSKLPDLDLNILDIMFAIAQPDKASSGKLKVTKKSIMDPKRAQNLGILFTGCKPGSLQLLHEAISSVAEHEDFDIQKMTTFKRYQPTAEDIELYRAHSTYPECLTTIDQFMLRLCEIPKLSLRIDLTLALWIFPSNYLTLREEINHLRTACAAVLENDQLTIVLRCLLAIGNHLNNRQMKNTVGFQISSIDKMMNLKGRDRQYTLMTYLVEQLKSSQPELLHWCSTLEHVQKVVGYSLKAINAEVEVLKSDHQKVKKYLKALRINIDVPDHYYNVVENFIWENDGRIHAIQLDVASLNVEYIHLLTWLGEPLNRTSDALFSSLSLLIERFLTAKARVY